MTDATLQNTPMIREYDRLAPRYDALHRRWLRFAGGEAQAALEAAVRVAMTPGSTLLDAGCGTGRFARTLIREGIAPEQITLMDASAAMLAQCADIPVCKRQGRLEALPFAPDTFDVVTCAWALETTAKPADALRELCRVLRPNGALLLTFCAEKTAGDAMDWIMQKALKMRRTGRFLQTQHVVYTLENEMGCRLRVLPCTGPAVTLFVRRSPHTGLGHVTGLSGGSPPEIRVA